MTYSINKELKDKRFPIVDAALFWVEILNISLPQHRQTLYDNMFKRPVVKQLLQQGDIIN